MTKQYIGYGSLPYDSRAEAKASFQFAELGCFATKKKFEQIFTDAEGTEFRACPDFYHAGSCLYIEFKTHTLNGVKTKASSDKQLASKEAFKGVLSMFDRLKLAWNHAKPKHAIVQKVLTPQNYIVVFETPPTDKEAITYIKAGIVFIPLSALPSYLAYVRLAKAGLNASFQLSYSNDHDETTVLSLGDYVY